MANYVENVGPIGATRFLSVKIAAGLKRDLDVFRTNHGWTTRTVVEFALEDFFKKQARTHSAEAPDGNRKHDVHR